MKLIKFNELPSTNTYLKEHYDKYDNYTIIWAKHQTSGKGRLGRTWIADDGSACFSIIIKKQVSDIKVLPLVAAMSVHQVLRKKIPFLMIKWPNDILVNEKKLVGILVENVYQETLQAVIVGIGINVNNDIDLSILNATSIYQETKTKSDIKQLIIEVVERFISNIEAPNKEVIDYINKYLSIKDKQITYTIGDIENIGVALRVSGNGNLVVKLQNDVLELFSGEVTLKKSNKYTK